MGLLGGESDLLSSDFDYLAATIWFLKKPWSVLPISSLFRVL